MSLHFTDVVTFFRSGAHVCLLSLCVSPLYSLLRLRRRHTPMAAKYRRIRDSTKPAQQNREGTRVAMSFLPSKGILDNSGKPSEETIKGAIHT